MLSVQLLPWLFILLTLLGSCTSHPEDARQELSQFGIAYTPEAFLKSVGENKVRAVALFLAAGMDPNMEKSGWLPPSDNGRDELRWASVTGRQTHMRRSPSCCSPTEQTSR